MSSETPCRQDCQGRHATIVDMNGERVHALPLDGSTRVQDILNELRSRRKRLRDCVLVHDGEALLDSEARVHELGLPREVSLTAVVQDLRKHREEGGTAKRLKSSGFTVAGLTEAGYSLFAVRHAGYSAEEVFRAGYSARELSDTGYDVDSVADLARALRASGEGSAARLRARDFDARHLLRAGYDAQELLDAGFSLKKLVEGLAPRHSEALRGMRLTAERLFQAGCSAFHVRVAGWSAHEAFGAGYSARELIHGGYDDWSMRELLQALLASGYSGEVLRRRGFTPGFVLRPGVDVKSLVDAGYPLAELVGGDMSNLPNFKAWGVTAEQLRKAGCTVSKALRAGYTRSELAQAGF
eukprot:TRINITY_DN124655_c0_g1_i1.p1 TRINITY_DN124655_c0_g1~~TRINITY_DN124655_c0_g1_i1.p1  ORF type:complete len:355 (-),score=36.80 TRINITY_DN124655_c0_g1_i1:149-1213(-)